MNTISSGPATECGELATGNWCCSGLTGVMKVGKAPAVMTMHRGAADFGGLFTDSRNLIWRSRMRNDSPSTSIGAVVAAPHRRTGKTPPRNSCGRVRLASIQRLRSSAADRF